MTFGVVFKVKAPAATLWTFGQLLFQPLITLLDGNVHFSNRIAGFGRNMLSRTSPKKIFSPIRDSFVQVGKRFVKAASESDDNDAKDVQYERHERSKIYFAKAHQRHLSRQEEIEKERRGRRQAQVNLMRSYRIGELPDIQVSYTLKIKHTLKTELLKKNNQMPGPTNLSTENFKQKSDL